MSPRPALLTLFGLLGLACDGYLALPLRERAFAPMTFTGPRATLTARGGRSTRVEVRLDPVPALSEAAPPPWVIVGAPAVASAGAEVAGWAVGPCTAAPASGPQPVAIGAPLFLCLAVRWDPVVAPAEPLVLTVVAEARATGQRVTFIGDARDASEPTP
jgi:hypothetical protein